jgi:DNA (cytosine-5)-methyltransferase 1
VRALELFSCSGGLAAGFRAAGIDFFATVDSDPNACASYESNLGIRPLQIDVRDLLRMLRSGWSAGGVDLVVADPPCAPWSRAGKKKGLEDERDLLRETVEIIAAIRPRAYLVGNIPGLQDATSWPVVQETIGSLSKLGYCARDFAVLDAADYGVPQRRARPYWYGHREGSCIVWPAATHCDPRKLRQRTLPGHEVLRPWVTCREALAGLSPEDLGRLVRVKAPSARPVNDKKNKRGVIKVRDRVPQSARLGDPGAPAATLTARPARSGSGDSVVLSLHPKHPINQPKAPAWGIGVSGAGAKGGKVMGWPWDRPATTVCAGIDKIAPAGEHAGQFGPNAIVLSEKAAAILQGFPPSWVFVGKTKAARWSQIGQAVPPIVAEGIGRSILRALGAAESKGAA